MNIYLMGVDDNNKIKLIKEKVKKIVPEGFYTSNSYYVSFERINTFVFSPCHIYFLDKKIAERCFLTIKNNAIEGYQEPLCARCFSILFMCPRM